MLLSKAKLNEKYIIKSIEGSHILKRRILEMGFTANVEIEIINKSFFNDPIIVKLRGYIVSLRLFEASHINVVKKG